MDPIHYNKPLIPIPTHKLHTPTNITSQPTKLFSLTPRPSDKIKAFFTEIGVLNSKGERNPLPANYRCPPAGVEELTRLEQLAKTPTKLDNNKISFDLEVDALQTLRDVIRKGSLGVSFLNDNNELKTILLNFASIEASGSAVIKKILRMSYLKKFVTSLNKAYNPRKTDQELEEDLKRLFTPDIEEALLMILDSKLNDFDIRLELIDNKNNTYEELLECTLDCFVLSLKDRLKPIEKKDRPEILAKIKKAHSHKNLEWLTCDDNDFTFYAIKYGALTDRCVITEGDNAFGVAGLGRDLKLEFISYLSLAKKELARSVRLPMNSLIYGLPTQEVELLGDDPVQALLDFLCNEVHFSVEKKNGVPVANSDEFKMVVCNSLKGISCATPNGDKYLSTIVRAQSEILADKTVYKVVKENPQLKENLQDIYPFFVAKIIEEITTDHFQGHIYSCIVATLKTLSMLEFEDKEAQTLLNQVKKIWVALPKNKRQNLLCTLIEFLTDVPGPITEKLSFLSLLSYLASHHKKNILPFTLFNALHLDMTLEVDDYSYHLFFTVNDPDKLLKDSLNFLRLPKNDAQNKLIKRLMGDFTPHTFSPVGSSLLLHHPLHSRKAIDLLLEASDKLIKRNNAVHSAFGILMAITLQPVCVTTTLQTSLFSTLLSLLSKWPENKEFLWEGIGAYLTAEEDSKTLGELRSCSQRHVKENQYVDDWLFTLAKSPRYYYLVFDLWNQKILKSSPNDNWLVLTTDKLLAKMMGTHEFFKILYEMTLKNKYSLNATLAWLEKIDSNSDRYSDQIVYDIEKIILLLNDKENLSGALLTRVANLIKKLPQDIISEDLAYLFEKDNNRTSNKVSKGTQQSAPSIHIESSRLVKSKEDLLAYKIQAIDKLIERLPEDAATRWVRLVRVETELTVDIFQELTNKIVEKLKASSKYCEIYDLLFSLYSSRAENAFLIALKIQTLAGMQEDHLLDNQDKVNTAVTNILKYASKKPLADTDYIPITTILYKLTLDDFELTPGTVKLIKQLSPELGNKLSTLSEPLSLLNLYTLLYRLDVNNKFIEDFHPKILSGLLTLVSTHKYDIERNENAKQFIDACTTNPSCKQSKDLLALLRLLAKQSSVHSHLFRYLNYLARIHSLVNKQDYDYLCEISVRFLESSDFYNAHLCLQYFKGKLKVSEATSGTIHLTLLEGLLKDNKVTLCLENLLSSQIIWDTPTAAKRLKNIKDRIFEVLLEEKTLIREEAILPLIRLIEMNSSTSLYALIHLFKKSLARRNPDITDLLWDILDKPREFHNLAGDQILETLWLLCIDHLGDTPLKTVLQLFKSERLFDFTRTKIKKDNHRRVYQTLIEVLQKAIKSNKIPNLKEFGSIFIEKQKKWSELLGADVEEKTVFQVVDIQFRCSEGAKNVLSNYKLIETIITKTKDLSEEGYALVTKPYISDLQTVLKALLDQFIIAELKEGIDLYLPFLDVIRAARKANISSFFFVRCIGLLHKILMAEAREELLCILEKIETAPDTEIKQIVESIKDQQIFPTLMRCILCTEVKDIQRIFSVLIHPNVNRLINSTEKGKLVLEVYKTVHLDLMQCIDRATFETKYRNELKIFDQSASTLSDTDPGLVTLFQLHIDARIRMCVEAETPLVDEPQVSLRPQTPNDIKYHLRVGVVYIERAVLYLKGIHKKNNPDILFDRLVKYTSAYIKKGLSIQNSIINEGDLILFLKWNIILMSQKDNQYLDKALDLYELYIKANIFSNFKHLEFLFRLFFKTKFEFNPDSTQRIIKILDETPFDEPDFEQQCPAIGTLIYHLGMILDSLAYPPVFMNINHILKKYSRHLCSWNENLWISIMTSSYNLPSVLNQKATCDFLSKNISTLFEIAVLIEDGAKICYPLSFFITKLPKQNVHVKYQIALAERVLVQFGIFRNLHATKFENKQVEITLVFTSFIDFVENVYKPFEIDSSFDTENILFKLANLWHTIIVTSAPHTSHIQNYIRILLQAFIRTLKRNDRDAERDFALLRSAVDLVTNYAEKTEEDKINIGVLFNRYVENVRAINDIIPRFKEHADKLLKLIEEKGIKLINRPVAKGRIKGQRTKGT